METPKRISPQMQQFLAAPVTQPTHDSAFGAHGFWSPGVRLMRNLQFAGKSLIISVVFMVPIVVLAWAVWGGYGDKRDFNQLEAQGVHLLASLAQVTEKVSATRDANRAMLGGFDASASYKASRVGVDAALAQFEADLSRSPRMSAQLQPLAQDFKKAWSTALNAPVAFDASGKTAYAPVAQLALDLTQSVGDVSGAVLDPDVDTLYLVLTTTQTMPRMVESLGQMRAFGAYFAGMGPSLTGAEKQKALLQFAVFDAELRSSLQDYKHYIDKVVGYNPALKAELDTGFVDAVQAYRAKLYQAITSDAKMQPAEVWNGGQKVHDEVSAAYLKLFPVLSSLVQARQKALNTEHYPLFALSAISVLLAAYLFFSFFLVTRGGLGLISLHLAEIAQGDLRKPPAKPWGTDEAAGVILDLITCYNSLYGLIRKVRHSARALHAASEEISAASLDLSGRTEAAGAALEQQASSMEEIGSTVKATADHALMAATFAQDNAQVAEKGGKVFEDVVNTMRDIQTSSTQIGDIVGVIDGIAFQTNILALNAAVEAARAGESGRGFAVVATEVRSLAQRSAAAARQIKGLIDVGVQKVQGGTVVVENAGRTMNEVVINARQINVFLGEISTAAQEQADGVLLVAQSIQELDKNTQQNAALVEQTTAAAGALKSQAEILQEEISNFRVA